MAESDIKAKLRRQALNARAALSPTERASAADTVAGHFFADIPLDPGETVALYWPIRDELDCRPILMRLMARSQIVALPSVVAPDAPLDLWVWAPDTPLYNAGFGTLAPADDAPRAVPDVMVMPLVGFDNLGTRLGYGKGYYDRTLASLSRKPRLIGLAFAVQELDAIPRGVHDVPLDTIITEAGVRHFGAA